MAEPDGDTVDDAGTVDGTGPAEVAGELAAGTGLDDARDSGVEGAAAGVGEAVEGAALGAAEAVEGAGLDGVAACVVDPTGLGAGDVVLGCGEDAEGDGMAGARAGDDPEIG